MEELNKVPDTEDKVTITTFLNLLKCLAIKIMAEKIEDSAMYETICSILIKQLDLASMYGIGGLALVKILMFSLLILGRVDECANYLKKYGRYSAEPEHRRPKRVPHVGGKG